MSNFTNPILNQLRVFNQRESFQQQLVVRIQSDNFDGWMTTEVYIQSVLEMSTGDHATHRSIGVWVDVDQLDNLRGRETGLIEHYYDGDDLEPSGLMFWSEWDADVVMSEASA